EGGDARPRGGVRGTEGGLDETRQSPHPPGPPPWLGLRERLLARAAACGQAGHPAEADGLRALVAEWWREQEPWNERMEAMLELHHEINNALVGVRGNVQLMLMNPAGQVPGLREKLEVVLRESGRIQEATARLRDLKSVLGGPHPRPRAA